MRRIAATVLISEGLVVFFATLVALGLSDYSHATVWAVGLTTMLACFVASGMLRFSFGYVVGSVLQGVVVATGVVVTAMYFLGVVFAGLWFLALYLGRRVEQSARPAETPE